MSNRIHGYSQSKFQSLISVSKDQKWSKLKNTKVFFKRTWEAVRRWEIITDKKLAEWSIAKLESRKNKKKPLPDSIKSICSSILPKITHKKDYALLKARYDEVVSQPKGDKTDIPFPKHSAAADDDDGDSSSFTDTSGSDDDFDEQPVDLHNIDHDGSVTHDDDDSGSSSTDTPGFDDDFNEPPVDLHKADDSKSDNDGTIIRDDDDSSSSSDRSPSDEDFGSNIVMSLDSDSETEAESPLPIVHTNSDNEKGVAANSDAPPENPIPDDEPSNDAKQKVQLPDVPLDQSFIGPSLPLKRLIKKPIGLSQSFIGPSKSHPLSQSLTEPMKPADMDLARSADDILLKQANLSSSGSVRFKVSKKHELDKKRGKVSAKSVDKLINPKISETKVIKKAKAICDNIKRGWDIDKDDAHRILERLYVVQNQIEEKLDATDDERKMGLLEEKLNRLVDMSNYIDAMILANEFVPDKMTDSFNGSNISQAGPGFFGKVGNAFGALFEAGKAAVGFIGSTARNLNEADKQEANRVKASKYECLLEVLSLSLEDDLSTLVQEGKRLDLEVLGKLQAVLFATKTRDVERSDLAYLTEVRDAFEYDALNGLRDAIMLCETYPNDITGALKSKVYETAYDLYTTNEMVEETEALLEMLTNYKGRKDFADVEDSLKDYDYDILKRLEYISKVIDGAPSALTTYFSNRAARSLKDYFSLGFSPIGAGNPPQVMGTLNLMLNGQPHPINIIGMGSPTMQPWSTALTHNAIIDPLFVGFQRHMEALEETHLYISLQDARSGEKKRNIPIMQVQDDLESFYAITLSKNSHFYEGEGPDDKQAFMEELHRQVFDCPPEESGCYISEKVRAEIKERTGEFLEETSIEMLVALDECFFASKEVLTKEEREHFVELYYNVLVAYIAVSLEIDHMNFTCKDGIDRGMHALTWFKFLFVVINHQEDTDGAEKTLMKTLYPRAYWTRKRNIISSRKKRFMHDAQWLLNQLQDKEKRAKFEGLVAKFMPGVTQAGLQSLADK